MVRFLIWAFIGAVCVIAVLAIIYGSISVSGRVLSGMVAGL